MNVIIGNYLPGLRLRVRRANKLTGIRASGPENHADLVVDQCIETKESFEVRK